jgi:outer membrane protein TolC
MNDARGGAAFFLFMVCCCFAATAALAQRAPLTLKQAITLALQNSSELALAKARYAVAAQQEAQARAAFRPNLFTGSGAAYTYGFPMAPGGSAPSLFNLSYVQTVFNPPLRGQAKAAAQRVEVERLSIARGEDAVILRTAAVFLDLVQVRHSLEVRRGARSAVQRIRDITSSRVAEGRELPVDSVRAELSAARAEQRIIELEGREEALVTELRALTGLQNESRLVIAPETLTPPEQATPDLVALALASSTELQQAERERRAGQDRLQGERGGYWPSLDIVGEYATFAKFNNYDQFFRTFQRHNLNVGIQARWAIFSAQTASAVAVARSELQQIEVELKRKREAIELSVRRDAQRARELKAVREVARLELHLAQENLRMLQERFQAERVNLRDVELARVEESERWVAFLQADYESQQAQLELLKATGQLRRVLP